jgi:hypothetical protein
LGNIAYRDREDHTIRHPRELAIADERGAVNQKQPVQDGFRGGCTARSRQQQRAKRKRTAARSPHVENVWKERGSLVQVLTVKFFFGSIVAQIRGAAHC